MTNHVEQRRYLMNFAERRLPHVFTDVLVIGSGAAGLSAAIEAASRASVIVVTKDGLRSGSTQYAQGGVAAAVSPDDSIAEHIEDTLNTGRGLSDPAVVRRVISEGPECLGALIDRGARFDKSSTHDGLALGREGGHSRSRIVHSSGDATGAEIQRVLTDAAETFDNIQMMKDAFVIDLVTDAEGCHGGLLHNDKGSLMVVWARAVILATGGCGRLFRETTNPEGITGDGCAMAWRAGAVLQDMEFIQFHPTTLYMAGASRALISEAVRGEGGLLRNKDGERFMTKYHPSAELAPRDVVSRSIVAEMKRTKAVNVLLDVTHMKPGFFAERFPTIHSLCSEFDIDETTDLIPVRPSAHYMIGGVRADQEGRTNIERLFAVGEVASTGLHGANRLASNSLLEAFVFGRSAGEAAGRLAAAETHRLAPRKILHDYQHGGPGRLIITDVVNALTAQMWRCAGIERNHDDLVFAELAVDQWCSYIMDREFESPEGWQLQDMLTVAKIIISGALRRTESRGAHYRTDFPSESTEWRRHNPLDRTTGTLNIASD